METLDASYALLSDAMARSRELQARLRSSLPLLWTHNALVMKSTARPRRRRALAEPSADGEADQTLFAVGEQSSQQASRRYTRRIEWEVARRIARVDRELQQYPPAQRFWNQKTRELASTRSSSHRKPVKHDKTMKSVGTSQNMKTRNTANIIINHEKKAWVKPTMKVDAATEVQCVLKHIGTSPIHGDIIKSKTIENAKPNAAIKTQPEQQIGVNATKKEILLNEDVVMTPTVEETTRKSTEVVKLQENQSTPDKSIIESSFKDSEGDEGDREKEFDLTNGLRAETSNNGEDGSSIIKENIVIQNEKATEKVPSSSIGRQVKLSDFRTLPSEPTSAQTRHRERSGDSAKKYLSADVLRRLFSDLDSDKDGHVNRIETCMALHRLQIRVSTARIISFFHNIHKINGKCMQSHRTQHLPMNELINYKEFVAFITAAFDQQHQRELQRAQHEVKMVSPALFGPSKSPSLPKYTDPKTSCKKVNIPPVLKREDYYRVYEVKDEEFEQKEEAGKRMFEKIPDFLINRILADSYQEVSLKAEEKAVFKVRNSRESLIEQKAADEKVITEITQELIKEQLLNSTILTQEAPDDVTGLKRAAAYSKHEMMQEESDWYGGVMANTENIDKWIDVVIEEQVSSVVHKLCRDKQVNAHNSLAPIEDANVTIPKSHFARWIDKATETNELSASAVLIEKAVQAFDERIEENSGTAHENIDTASQKNVPISDPLTHFGRFINEFTSRSTHDNKSSVMLRPITSITILQQLRQQRHQNTYNEQKVQSFVSAPCKKASKPNVLARSGMKSGIDNINAISLAEDLNNSLSGDAEDVCELVNETGRQNLAVSITKDSVPLDTILMDPMNEVDAASSKSSHYNISVSSDISSISSDDESESGIYKVINSHLQTSARSVCYQRLNLGHIDRSVSESNDIDSICSVKLSEGELSTIQSLGLSDGEILGKWKRICCKRINTMDSQEESSQNSSVESGELPALIKIDANYRGARSSSSSVESGELEDGAFDDFSS
ncbi:EF-hand domain pair [Plasmopara halstedii]|uniref:EF-hand domain pair n=1 Tax=Plasmopara halstedii TaxID=4781 RepID=A0A0P1ALQ9_PLAHL|nr:EF-hand domain pair [Plasmopara halstedii]CEG41832.1 EF-hand domain pair [Plasmopara halstedii]|eukprot:XP_024578201.1 EF-hand domain pair [Plasmopara halstedii]